MKKIKCIIISDDHYNGLGMIRSLGLLNMDVILILLSMKKTFINSSKYVDNCIKVAHSRDSIIKVLNDLFDKYSNYLLLLYPLNDFAVQVLDSEYMSFPGNVFSPNAHGKIQYYSNKQIAKRIAAECGLSIPAGKIIDIKNGDIGSLKDITFPVIIKPVVSVEGAKSHIKTVYDKEQYQSVIDGYGELGYTRILVEEYICGHDSYMIEVMGARGSNKKVEFAGIIKKYREYPIVNGSTSYATIIQNHKYVDFQKLISFLSTIDYVGIFDFEFKYSNEKLYFIECNYRNGAPGFVFTKNGYNLPGVWAELELGIDLNLQRLKLNDVDFMVEQNDMINMLKGTPKFFTWIKEYVHSSKVFSFHGDPRPVRLYYWYFFKNIIIRFTHRNK